jgi:SNF2 family DNA or RNA helicase
MILTIGAQLTEFGAEVPAPWLYGQVMTYTPAAHQKEMMRKYLSTKRFLDAGEPGTGKTLPAHFHGIVEAAAGKRVLYTMPPKLIGQFYDEMLNVFPNVENHLYIEKLNVPAAQKVKLLERWNASGWPDILMLSYDNYREFNDVLKVKNIGTNQWYNGDGVRVVDVDRFPGPVFTKDGRPINRRRKNGSVYGTAPNNKHLLLTRNGYNVQFFDEAHSLCGLKSIISQSVSDAARRDSSIYLMTGTPVPTEIVNAYGIIRLINPEAYGNLASFERQHIVKRPMTIMRGGRPTTINVVDHYVNTEKIHTELFRFARRIQKREIHKLPDPIIQDIKVALTGKHRKLYDTFMKNQFAVIGDTILSPESQQQARHMSLQLISCPNVFDPELSMKNDLYDRFKELVDSINPKERKIVIFAYHKVVIDFLHAELAEYNPAILNGSTADSEEQIRKFKEDKNCGVFVVNWESGGAGLNLQMASHVIFYEVPGVKAFKQGVARCDRTGQTETVNVYIMRVLSTLSDRSFSRLLKAEEDLNEVVKDELDLLYKVVGRPRK